MWCFYNEGVCLIIIIKSIDCYLTCTCTVMVVPDSAWCFYNEGVCLIIIIKSIDCYLTCTCTVMVVPDSAWCFYNEGVCLMRWPDGDKKQAYQSLIKAMK